MNLKHNYKFVEGSNIQLLLSESQKALKHKMEEFVDGQVSIDHAFRDEILSVTLSFDESYRIEKILESNFPDYLSSYPEARMKAQRVIDLIDKDQSQINELAFKTVYESILIKDENILRIILNHIDFKSIKEELIRLVDRKKIQRGRPKKNSSKLLDSYLLKLDGILKVATPSLTLYKRNQIIEDIVALTDAHGVEAITKRIEKLRKEV